MKFHHATETGKYCKICDKPILNYWTDKEGKNGKSDLVQERLNGDIYHYRCLPNFRTLKQINEERKLLK